MFRTADNPEEKYTENHSTLLSHSTLEAHTQFEELTFRAVSVRILPIPSHCRHELVTNFLLSASSVYLISNDLKLYFCFYLFLFFWLIIRISYNKLNLRFVQSEDFLI